MPRQLVGPRLGVAGTDRRVAAPLSSHQGPPTVPARTRLLSLGADKGGHLPAGSGLRLWRTERQRTGHSGGDTDRGFCSAFIRSCLFAAGELGALKRGTRRVGTALGTPVPAHGGARPVTPAQRPLLNRRTQGRSRSPTRHVLTSHGRPRLSRTHAPAVWT